MANPNMLTDRFYAQNETDIYKYSASVTFIVGTQTIAVEAVNIKSILTDNDYKANNMPIIFITMTLNKNDLDSLIKNQDNGSAIINIQRCIASSDTPEIYVDYLNDTFLFTIGEDVNKNSSVDYADSNAERPDIFRIVTIGFLSLDLINKNKKAVSGVLSGNKSSILYYLTGHLPMLIEPMSFNNQMNRVFIPPQNSVSKSIAYINNLSVLYDTQYRFYMDFRITYLISSSGKSVPRHGDKVTSINLKVLDSSNPLSQVSGMYVDPNGTICTIYISENDCQVSDIKLLDKSYSVLDAVSTQASTNTANVVNPGLNITKKKQVIRVPNENMGLLNNMKSSIAAKEIQLALSKTDIDSSILTINKEYIIECEEAYGTTKYDGRYILARKRELYMREDQSFNMRVMLIFERVGDIQK